MKHDLCASLMTWLAAFRRSFGVPLLCGMWLSLTWYPWDVRALAWICLVPLLTFAMDERRRPREVFGGAFIAGTIYAALLLHPLTAVSWWGWGSVNADGLRSYLSYQRLFMHLLLGVGALWGGVWIGLFGLLVRQHARTSLSSLLIIPSLWVLLVDYLAHRLVSGLTWGVLGYRLADDVYLRQLASLTGIYGLSFLLVMVNVAVSLWVSGVRRALSSPSLWDASIRQLFAAIEQAWARRHVRWSFGLCAFVLAGALGYGIAAVHRPATGPGLQVALLQGSAAAYTTGSFTPEGLDQSYAAMIRQAVTPPTDIVVLPETVWFKTLQLDGTTPAWDDAKLMISKQTFGEAIQRQLGQQPSLLVHGIDAVANGRLYNSTLFWTTEGLLGGYFKRRLVPFSEYRPKLVGALAPQNRLHSPGFSYSPGASSNLVSFRGLRIGSFICQEVMVPELIRRSVWDGAQLLVTTGNDGVFADPGVAVEQARMARLRAVEHRRYILRSVKSGLSAIIDPWGREVAAAPLGAQGVVRGQAVALSSPTAYTRWGNWIVWISGLLACAALMRQAGARRIA